MQTRYLNKTKETLAPGLLLHERGPLWLSPARPHVRLCARGRGGFPIYLPEALGRGNTVFTLEVPFGFADPKLKVKDPRDLVDGWPEIPLQPGKIYRVQSDGRDRWLVSCALLS
jgi:hypothetical protein